MARGDAPLREHDVAVDRDAPIGLQCRYQVIAFTFDAYTSPPAESPDFVY